MQLIIQLASYITIVSTGQPIGDGSLGYTDHCIALKNTIMVTFHYAVIMIDTLMCSK